MTIMIITILAWVFVIFQVMFDAQVKSSKVDESVDLSSSKTNLNELTLRSGAPCQTSTIIAITLGGFCCLGAVAILLMIFFVLKRYEQIKKYKQVIDMLIEGGGISRGEVQKQMGVEKKKSNRSASSNDFWQIYPSSPGKADVDKKSKIRKRKTKESDVSVDSIRTNTTKKTKKTPITSSPLSNRSNAVGQTEKTSGNVPSKLVSGKQKAKEIPAPKFVVLSSAASVKSSGLGNVGSTTRRSMSYKFPQTSDSTSPSPNKQE